MCPLHILAMLRVIKSQTAIRPSLQPTASSVPRRLNAHVRASLPESKMPSLCYQQWSSRKRQWTDVHVRVCKPTLFSAPLDNSDPPSLQLEDDNRAQLVILFVATIRNLRRSSKFIMPPALSAPSTALLTFKIPRQIFRGRPPLFVSLALWPWISVLCCWQLWWERLSLFSTGCTPLP